MAASGKTRRRVSRRWWLAIVALLTFGIGVGWVLFALNVNPSWYVPPDATSEQVIELGHATQNRVISAVHEIRRDEPDWTVRLSDAEMNAWIAVNLPGWLEHEFDARWPPETTLPVVSTEPGAISLGFQVPEAFADRVLTVTFEPSVTETDDQSGIVLAVTRIGLGRLRVPVSMAGGLIDQLRGALGSSVDAEAAEELMTIFREGARVDAMIDLSDRRRVRILDIDCGEGVLTMTCRTVRDTDQRGELRTETEDAPHEAPGEVDE